MLPSKQTPPNIKVLTEEMNAFNEIAPFQIGVGESEGNPVLISDDPLARRIGIKTSSGQRVPVVSTKSANNITGQPGPTDQGKFVDAIINGYPHLSCF